MSEYEQLIVIAGHVVIRAGFKKFHQTIRVALHVVSNCFEFTRILFGFNGDVEWYECCGVKFETGHELPV